MYKPKQIQPEKKNGIKREKKREHLHKDLDRRGGRSSLKSYSKHLAFSHSVTDSEAECDPAHKQR
jgi:hypothetical protein